MSRTETEGPVSPEIEAPRRRLFPRLIQRAHVTLPFAGGMLVAFVAFLLYGALTPAPAQLTQADVDSSIAQALASATPPPAYSALVYQVVQPSLVFIQGQTTDENGESGAVIGSGVVIDAMGDILTALHVVDGVSNLQVGFADGTVVSATVIAEQPQNDIAVLAPSQMPSLIVPAILGNPNAMNVGDEVFAVGNPLGLYSSMSAGVISGFERAFHPPDAGQRLEGLIQIDAAVNPGNSGGPLLNRAGQVVGVVVGIANPTQQEVFIGIGFAVPISVAARAAGLPAY